MTVHSHISAFGALLLFLSEIEVNRLSAAQRMSPPFIPELLLKPGTLRPSLAYRLYAYISAVARLADLRRCHDRHGGFPLLSAKSFFMGNGLASHARGVRLGGALVELFLQPLASVRRSGSHRIVVEIRVTRLQFADVGRVLVRERGLSVAGSTPLAAHNC